MWNKIIVALVIFLPFQFATNLLPGSDVSFFRILILFVLFGYILFSLGKGEMRTLPIGGIFWIFSVMIVVGVSLGVADHLDWAVRKGVFLINFLAWYGVLSFLIAGKKIKPKMVIMAIIVSGTVISGIGIAQWISQFVFGLERILFVWREYVTPFFLGSVFSETVLEYPSWLVNVGGFTLLRAFSVFPDPHMFAFFIELCFPWAIFSFLGTKKKIYLIWAIVMVVAILLSFSRGAYLGLIIGFFVVGFFIFRGRKIRIREGILIGTFLVLGGLFLFGTENFIRDRLSDTFLVIDSSGEERIFLWKHAFGVIMENPIFGVGLGVYPETVQPSATYRDPIYAHNLYLDITVEMGLVGLFIWMAGFFWMMRSFYLLGKANPVFLAGTVSLAIFSIHGIFDTPLYSIHVLGILCVLGALGWSQPTSPLLQSKKRSLFE